MSSGKGPAKMFARAHILLKADVGEGGPGWPYEKIAEALDVTIQTIERVRKQLVEEGLEAALIAIDTSRRFLLLTAQSRKEKDFSIMLRLPKKLKSVISGFVNC